MDGRGRATGVGVGGGGWPLQRQHRKHPPPALSQAASSSSSRTSCRKGLPIMGFPVCGDLGLATTAGSSSLLNVQKFYPLPGSCYSTYSSAGDSTSSTLSGQGSASSGSAASIRSSLIEGEVGCPDLVRLCPLTEEAILQNLSLRHKRDQIYTNLGTALISVNPYKRSALYSPEILFTYKNCCLPLPPHIFAMADVAHRGVWERHADQVVVAVGESGAGKTEAVKLLLQYITTAVSTMPNPIISAILHSNLLLEAFGNSRTRRNDNSSRFGKYVDIEFSYDGSPTGGTITSYLLEKARVTTHNHGEKNFHIFYQLLAGAEIQTLKALKLQRNLENYRILKSKRHHSVTEAADDKSEFLKTKRAFEGCGFTFEEQLEVLKIVAAVLKIGNLTFTPVNNIDGSEGCAIENEYELLDVSELLQSDFSYLMGALQTRTLETHCEELIVELSSDEASRGRDALCRALYSRTFSWIVSRINETLKMKTIGRRKVLGLLDIYGFESIQQNGFQQLIINYFNEKIHQVLSLITLRAAQEDYMKESLEWSWTDIITNTATVELLEQSKCGILSVIEDASTKSGGNFDAYKTNDEMLEQLATMCGSHPNFDIKRAKHQFCDNNLPSDAFRIRHFAGAVTYGIRGFTEKNCDNLARNLTQAMYQCKHPILKLIFPEGNPRRTTLKRPSSTVSQAQVSVGAILRTLQGKTLQLLICLKPNELKQPRLIESALLSQQINYHGLLVQARIRKDGWDYHCPQKQFLDRYRMLSLHTWPSWLGSPLEGSALLLADLPITPAEYTFGRSCVFIKNMRTVVELEQFRHERLDDLAILLQKTWRGWRNRIRFQSMKAAKIKIVAVWRTYKQREEIKEMKHRQRIEWAAGVIQYAYVNYQRYKLIMSLISDPPNESPISADWPLSSHINAELGGFLRRLHHRWRCYRYRLKFDQTSRNRMREKVTASLIFKDRKTSYGRSISHPFIGDYVRLRHNAQWKRLASETNDQYVVFADMVNKIARSSGKFVPILLALSTNSLLVIDQRTLQIKYRIAAADIIRVSLSPFFDDIAVLHVRPPSPTTDMAGSQNLNPGCLFGSDEVKRKGDLILQTCHIIEVVTKLFLVVQNATGKPPEMTICAEFDANFGQNAVIVTFKTAGLAEFAPSQIKIQRRHNRMEVIL